MGEKIQSHCDLEVYKKAFDAAMELFELSKKFPKEEIYSLTDQVRKSSRSVCANTAEAWRKRRYEASFISKLSDAEGLFEVQARVVALAHVHEHLPDVGEPDTQVALRCGARRVGGR